MLTGVAGRLFDEAFKGFRLTVALGRWGWGLRCRRTYGGGVTWPHPLEHDAQPYECDQRELVEEQMRDHGTPPHTRAAMRALYPVCQVAELTAGYRDTTLLLCGVPRLRISC